MARYSNGRGAKHRDPDGLEPFDIRLRLQGAYEVIRRRHWLMLGVFLGVVAASIIYVVKTAPEYAASSFLMVDDRRYDPSNALSMGYVASVDIASSDMQLEVLTKSPTIARKVAEKIIDLQVVPGTEERFSVLGEAHEEEFTSAALAAYLQQNVVTIQESGVNVIGVTARVSNAPEASFIANAFAQEAVDHSRDMSRQRITSSREFLEERIEEGRQNVTATEADMQSFMNRERAVALDQEVTTAVANLARVESARAETQIDLEMERASLRATEDELARIKPVLSRRVASGVDREIAAAQLRVAEMEARLEPFFLYDPTLRQNPESDPRTASLSAEIARLNAEIDRLSERYVQEVLAAGGSDPSNPESGVTYAASLERQLVTGRITISGLESKIAQLDRQYSDYEARLSRFPQQSVDLAKLERAQESSENLFSFLEQRLNEVTLAEQSETGSLQILRPAGIPASPTSPKPERIIPLAALLGFLLAGSSGWLASRLDRRLYTPADVERHGFHLLGVVPDMKQLITTLFGDAAHVPYQSLDVVPTMIGLTAPFSAPAEAYRQLYARLRSISMTRGAQTMVVTSPEASVGKSTTALNLAIAGATARQRTLIVDIDFRKPAVERYLGVPQRLTLQDLFELPANIDFAPRLAEKTSTGIPNLHAITLREAVGNPIEHLASPRLHALIEGFKKVFDLVIFDAPPMLLTADATYLTSECDVTVVIAGVGKTEESALLKVQRELAEADAGFTCVVLNRFDTSNRIFKSTYGYLSHNYGAYYSHENSRPTSYKSEAL